MRLGAREIATNARDSGVMCVLEPLRSVRTSLVVTVRCADLLIREVGASSLEIVLHTVSMASVGDSIDSYLETAGGLIQHVHLIDGNPGHLVLGEGARHLTEIVSGLAAGSYCGHATFELIGDGKYSIEPRVVLERCLKSPEPTA